MSLKKKKIFIFLQRNWGRKIGHPIAKKFSYEGASMGALTLQKDFHQGYLDDDLKYDWIASHDDIMNNPQKFLEDDNFSIEEAQNADEAFITSASTFVMPVVNIDGVDVGSGKPGKIAARLREIYLEETLKTAI